jgi:hypothetical protein
MAQLLQRLVRTYLGIAIHEIFIPTQQEHLQTGRARQWLEFQYGFTRFRDF